MSTLSMRAIKNGIARIREDLAAAKTKYAGGFVDSEVHIGLGNRKTHCVNEATLPIITCDPSCMKKCVGTCYVFVGQTTFRMEVRRYEAQNTVLRRLDPEGYYEHFYRYAEKEHMAIRLSDGGDFENEEQVKACIAVARRHSTVHAIVYTKRLNLLPAFNDRPATLHVRYSGWQGYEANEAQARALGYDITHVVQNGSGNCPYQIKRAQLELRIAELIRAFMAQGRDEKTAKRDAKRQAEKEIYLWHCRDCAEHGCGCCGKGDISFNEVGGANWATQPKSARRSTSSKKK